MSIHTHSQRTQQRYLISPSLYLSRVLFLSLLLSHTHTRKHTNTLIIHILRRETFIRAFALTNASFSVVAGAPHNSCWVIVTFITAVRRHMIFARITTTIRCFLMPKILFIRFDTCLSPFGFWFLFIPFSLQCCQKNICMNKEQVEDLVSVYITLVLLFYFGDAMFQCSPSS